MLERVQMERIYFKLNTTLIYGMYNKNQATLVKLSGSYWNVFCNFVEIQVLPDEFIHKIIALLLYAGHSGKQVEKWFNDESN